MEKKFKAFDKVIARFRDNNWMCDLYSHYNTKINRHVTLGFCDLEDDCILPYEGNEYLVGSQDSPEDEVRLEEGEYLICFDNLDYFKAEDFCLSPFVSIIESDVRTKDGNRWHLFIKFSDFNPNDMEETSRHILCVKDGRIIRYKD